ncbi:OmpA family protein [Salana multivorans]
MATHPTSTTSWLTGLAPSTMTTLAVAATLLVTGCSSPGGGRESADPAEDATPAAATPSAVSTPAAGATGAAAADSPPQPSPTAQAGPAVPGYAYGEVPPVPLVRIPDLGVLDGMTAELAPDLTAVLGSYPGLTIGPATCDESGQYVAGGGMLLAYGDGSGSYTGPDGSMWNYGDGSGTFSAGGVTATNYGYGSGSYVGNGVSVWNYGDGSGSYVDGTTSLWLYGDGSGSETSERGTLSNYGDGSASYVTDGMSIWNYGDGSGSYVGEGLTIWNYGNGAGMVNGKPTEVEPLPPAVPLGTFPPLGALEPLTSCGTRIVLESGVLFDIDQWDVRPDAATILDSLAAALDGTGAPHAIVEGHTDSVRSHEYNQGLSERRAAAVVDALRERGVTSELESIGYGETRLVAPEIVDGVDSPAGRQANRRVEVLIPAF